MHSLIKVEINCCCANALAGEKDELGKGQYGQCFKIKFDGREVAVKTTKSKLDRVCFKAFLKEAKLMAYIGKHENVVEFLGAYVDEIENC